MSSNAAHASSSVKATATPIFMLATLPLLLSLLCLPSGRDVMTRLLRASLLALQFGGQEPGSNAEVKKFAQARGAKFPIMAKVDVNGSKGEVQDYVSRLHAMQAELCK